MAKLLDQILVIDVESTCWKVQWPPPGQISIAVPVFCFAGGRYTVKEGRVTLVISRVLPTSFESWMRLFS